jgi:aspartyl-tRNA(Asn)/glutamyl-tRNA(Gln) amidotransferase subunit B
MKEYIPTIGLEIHAELKTNSKMFCACKNDPDEEKPNKNICPVCMGHPGTLPVLNKEAIKHVIKVGYAVGGNIADFTEWDRKNYFYPDIPKGYQISQYKYPLVSGGNIAGVDITRIHLEEDTAQSTHDLHEKSLVNFNRAGVPLMELVTEPVIHDADTAVKFAKDLQLLLRYLGVGEVNMEKGEMRVEANISIASKSDTENKKFGTKTEVKNLNSFKVVEKAILYEIKRQTELLNKGEKVIQETRGFDENTGKTYSQRVKESSHDYRYFPNPDIPKMKVSEIPEFGKDIVKKDMPELPWEKRERFTKDFGMTEKEVAVFVDSRHRRSDISRIFEAARRSSRCRDSQRRKCPS